MPPSRREELADQCLNCPPEAFPGLFRSVIEPIVSKKIPSLERDPDTAAQGGRILQILQEDTADPRRIAAALMYFYRFELPSIDLERLPDWFLDFFLDACQEFPRFFPDGDSQRRYQAYQQDWIRTIADRLAASDAPACWQRAAGKYFSLSSLTVQTYFSRDEVLPVFAARARIGAHELATRRCRLDYTPPARRSGKIRLGVIRPSWGQKTETFATIPAFADLDRKRFEVIIFAVEATDTPIEHHVRQIADRFVVLPQSPAISEVGTRDARTEIARHAEAIRSEDLDILFFASNITADFDEVPLLAMHRLARFQVASICCPLSTGIPTIDFFIAGSLTEPRADAQDAYTEQLLLIEGSGVCFRYDEPTAPTSLHLTRGALGIPEQATVFASGANLLKITPEVREAWGAILASVPESRLLIYPFGPAWISRYPIDDFMTDMTRRLRAHGVSPQRLLVFKPFDRIADIQQLLGLADLYLDSFPYSGATSILDPLFAGLPPVVVSGDRLRFAQGGAMLRELGLPELVARDPSDYVRLAATLANDPEVRQGLRSAIRQRMSGNPPFLDSVAFSRKMGKAFEQIVATSDRPVSASRNWNPS